MGHLELIVTLQSLPTLPPEAVHIFVPVIYIILFVVLLLGGFAAVLWRLFTWLQARIDGSVTSAIGAHEIREKVWQDSMTSGQEDLKKTFREGQTFLSNRIEAVNTRIDRLIEGT